MIQESIERLAEIETPANPFPGLRPFEFHESFLFFGREGQSERLIERISRTHFLAVVGTSGSGKSSLVRAGLLPALIGGMMSEAGSAWRVALMRPGNDPIGNLAKALNSRDAFGSEEEENRNLQIAITEATLRRGSLGLVEIARQMNMPSNENLIVIADQWEELFRVEPGAQKEAAENDKAAFVKLLLEASRQRETNIYVALTMRSDYLGDCSQFWDLPEAINEGQYLIPRLTLDQRRDAITGPVGVGGARITPRLVNRLISDVGDSPDQLPILQHALMRTWDKWKEENRPEQPVDLRHYEAIGGMAEALSLHADEAYNELPGELQSVAEKTFKALTEKGPDNREIRNQISLGEICAIAAAPEKDVITVIEIFRQQGRSFLMPTADTPLTADSMIDISHESLIRVWKRLSEWVDEESRSARQYQRLAETARLHDKGEEGLLLDPALQLALDWREQNKPNPAWARRYHADAGVDLRNLDAKQIAQEKAFNRVLKFLDASEKQRAASAAKRRAIIVALMLLTLFAIVAAGLAFKQKSVAEQKTKEAEAARKEAEVARQAAIEQRDIAEAATQDAIEQKDIAEAAKQDAIEQKAVVEKANLEAEAARHTAEEQRSEAEAAKIVAEQRRQEAVIAKNLADQQSLIATEKTKTVRQLLYVSDMNLAQKAFDVSDLKLGYELLNSYFPSPDAPKDDLRGFDWYYIWKSNHDESATLKGHSEYVSSVSFSADGKTLASGSDDKTIKLWDVASGRLLNSLEGHSDSVNSVSVTADGKTLASGSADKTIKLWDAASGRLLNSLKGHSNTVNSVSFSADGKTLASGSDDKTIRLWDVASGRLLNSLEGHSSPVSTVAFSADGKTLASGSWDKTIKLWDVASGRLLNSLEGRSSYVLSVSFSADGKTLASGSWDKTIRLWDVASGRLLNSLKGHSSPVSSVSFSADGKTLASGSADKTIRLWDVASERLLNSLEGHSNSVNSVSFSADGKTLASGSWDKTIKLWDVASGRLLNSLEGHSDSVNSVSFSADGKTLASGSRDKTIKLWDVASGRLLNSLEGHSDSVLSVAFSADGKTLASGNWDKTIRLWDVASGRLLNSLEGHLGYVSSVSFSADGKTLASGSWDKTIKLFFAATDEEVAKQRNK